MESFDHPTYRTFVTLTTRVLGWYGFGEAHNYPLYADAARIAVQLIENGQTPDTLTREAIEVADRATGGRMALMWEAVHGSAYVPTAH